MFWFVLAENRIAICEIAGNHISLEYDIGLNRFGRKRPPECDDITKEASSLKHCIHQDLPEEAEKSTSNTRRFRRVCLACDIVLWRKRMPRLPLSSLKYFIFHVITSVISLVSLSNVQNKIRIIDKSSWIYFNLICFFKVIFIYLIFDITWCQMLLYFNIICRRVHMWKRG